MKERIRRIMEEAGMSQKEFAERLKISPASLSNILAGKTSPTNYHVQAVHNAFPDININWLFCGTGDMHTAPAPSSETDEFGFSLETGAPQPGAVSPAPAGSIFEAAAAQPALDAQTIRPATAPQRPLFAQEQASRQENAYAKPAGFQFSPPTPQQPEKKERRIKEIRVFFDDGTLEVFTPSNK